MEVVLDGDALVQRLLDPDRSSEQRGEDAYLLLQEIFFRGYPVAKLSALLGSNNIEVVESGIWVLAELGAAAVSLLREVEPHLRSRSRKVRYWSIGVVHSSAGSEDGKIVAEAFGLLEDDDVVIRRAALFFLYRSSEVQLTAAIDYCGGGRFGSLLAWLRDVSSSRDAFSTIVKKSFRVLTVWPDWWRLRLPLESMAAKKIGLEWAAAEGDEEISVFAARELQG